MSGTRARTGVVTGKFYPPHRGHQYLIDTAAGQVERLTVIVCARADQTIPGELRAAWLRELYPAVTVLLIDDRYPADDSHLWAAKTIEWLGGAPDMVFTSEDYGDAYARYLGCRHMLVDRARRAAPISGTAIRQDPLGNWAYLAPPVRAYYARRVCLVGAESSGTTTLARALAEHYRTIWVPEYGREYAAAKLARGEYDQWTSAEFTHIATEQCRREDLAVRQANRLLICDTDAFATSIWHRRYLGTRSPAIEAIAAARHYDLYLLTDVDIPFVQDGTRDGEHLRGWMHDLFAAELTAQGRCYALLSGPHEARLACAIELIDRTVLA
jgi:HTH-type transcriptional regulator, transcriptional repressor of NAD biosynthesis genes